MDLFWFRLGSWQDRSDSLSLPEHGGSNFELFSTGKTSSIKRLIRLGVWIYNIKKKIENCQSNKLNIATLLHGYWTSSLLSNDPIFNQIHRPGSGLSTFIYILPHTKPRVQGLTLFKILNKFSYISACYRQQNPFL